MTVAVNCWVPPGCSVMFAGDTETCPVCAGCTVTCAEAAFVESATEVAVTTELLPAVDPAVNRPLLEMVPPVDVHATAVLELPVTVAVNCCICPGCRLTFVGET